jgi:hypothetical protein
VTATASQIWRALASQIEAIASESASDAMASVIRYDAIIASNEVDSEAIAPESDYDAMALVTRRFDPIIASNDIYIKAIASEFHSDG